MDEAARAGRANYETALLDILWARRQNGRPLLVDGDAAPLAYRDRIRAMYPNPDDSEAKLIDHFDYIVAGLEASGFIKVEALAIGKRQMSITTNGLRELGNRRPGSYDDLANVNRIMLGHVADLLDILEETRAEQGELDGRISSFDSSLGAHSKRIEETARDLHRALAETERNIYGQAFVLLGIFVAAFALILTAAQVAVRTTSTTPLQTMAQSAASMLPVTVAVVILVLVTWFLGRPHKGK